MVGILSRGDEDIFDITNYCWCTTILDLAAINRMTCATYMSSTLVTAISQGHQDGELCQLYVINYFYEDGILWDFCQHCFDALVQERRYSSALAIVMFLLH